MKKNKYIAMILAILFLAVGCKSQEETSQEKEESPSAISLDYINLTMVKPETINPLLNKDKSVGYITNLIYDGLFTINENYDVIPQLVDEFGISQDGSSINIKLKDANWHDGTPVTSRDVSFTVDTIKNNPESPYKFFVENIASISIISDKEFTIRFANNYAFSMDTLIFPIVSKNQLSSVSNNAINNYKNNLIGNGPYKIDEYNERESISLSVNKDYYDETPKNAKDIKVNMVPDSESQVAMVTALQSDIANVGLNDLSKFQEKEFNITNYEGRDYEFILFNYDNDFIRDVNFRKAISHGINRNQILDEAYMGDATIVNFPLNSSSKYYDKSLVPLEYSKEKAKEYLEKVKPISGNEIKKDDEEQENLENVNNLNNESDENINNKTDETKNIADKESINQVKEKTPEETKKMISELNLKIIVNKDNSERKKTAYLILNNLKSIGVKSTVVELGVEDMEKALNEKNYDLALVGWELSVVPDAISIIENSGFKDEQLDNYVASLKNATSQGQILDIYKSIQSYIKENVAFISLVIRDNYVVTNRRLEGKITPNDFDVYEGITNLNIRKK